MTLELTEEQKRAGWQVKRLGDIAPLKYGKGLPQVKRVPGSIPVYSSAGISGWHNEHLIDGTHIVIGRKGSIGTTYWVEGPLFPIDTTFYTAGASNVNLRWIYYLLKTFNFAEMNSDSAVPGLNREVFESQTILLPPLSEQNRIAEILGSLDDKIEANSRLLNSLDELGDTLAQKIIAESSETIPLSEVAEIVMGQSPAGASLNEDGEGTVFYQGRRDFGFRYPTARVFTTAPTRMAKTEDILLSVRAPVGDLNRASEECCVGRGVAAIRAKDGNTSQLFYLLKNSPHLWTPFEGEGTIFSSINRKQVHDLSISVTPADGEFSEIESAVSSLTNENISLTKTRDLLIRSLIGE